MQDLYKSNCRFQFIEDAAQTYDIEPYVSLKTPVFQLENISVCHPPKRPRCVIILTREHAHIEGKTEFSKTARHSLLSALKTLTNKPALCQELEYKLAQDVLN